MVKISFREKDEGPEKKKKPARKFDVFFDFEKMEKLVDEMMKGMVQAETKEGEKKPLVMGFQLRFDDKGQPVVENVGNVKPAEKRLEVRPRAPLVDVIKSEKDITITAELPGAEEKDIKLEVGEHAVEIKVERPSFYKRISFEESLDSKKVKSSLKNGVYEIVVKKK